MAAAIATRECGHKEVGPRRRSARVCKKPARELTGSLAAARRAAGRGSRHASKVSLMATVASLMAGSTADAPGGGGELEGGVMAPAVPRVLLNGVAHATTQRLRAA